MSKIRKLSQKEFRDLWKEGRLSPASWYSNPKNVVRAPNKRLYRLYSLEEIEELYRKAD